MRPDRAPRKKGGLDAPRLPLVVKAAGNNDQFLVIYFVDTAVGLVDSSGPEATETVIQGLGFANPGEGISLGILDQIIALMREKKKPPAAGRLKISKEKSFAREEIVLGCQQELQDNEEPILLDDAVAQSNLIRAAMFGGPRSAV